MGIIMERWAEEIAAECGAVLLDEIHPAWFIKINRDKLDMSHPEDCVLGQLYDTYEQGLDALILLGCKPWERVDYGFTWITCHGFIAATLEEWPHMNDETYQALTVAWTAEITRRLDTMNQAVPDNSDTTVG